MNTLLWEAIAPLTQLRASSSQDGCAQGNIPTRHDRVRVFWSEDAVERDPVLLDAGLIIVASGRKVGYHRAVELVYDPEHYLVVSAPIPFECSTIATPRDPLLGLFIQLELAELHELVATMELSPTLEVDGIGSARLSEPMSRSVARLARCLQSEVDTKILGDALVREVVYRALCGEHGGALARLTQHHSDYSRVARVLATVRADLSASWSVSELAAQAGMADSTFHRAFRGVTGTSPLQYVKAARLQRAYSMLRYDGVRAKEAAMSVGYESSSQFSREFSRYFQVKPSEVRALYQHTALSAR